MTTQSPMVLRQRRKLSDQCLIHFTPHAKGVEMQIEFPKGLASPAMCITTDTPAPLSAFKLDDFQKKAVLLGDDNGTFTMWQGQKIVWKHRYGEGMPTPYDCDRLAKRLAHWLAKNVLAPRPN